MDPYKVLGVNPNASQEDIRKAYLALVKKYHPDKYTDPAMKKMANEKLTEINAAYDMLTKPGGQNRGANPGWSPDGGWRTSSQYTGGYSGPNSELYNRARAFILSGNLEQAKAILDSISSHNAEWHYLYGLIYQRQGWYDQARAFFKTAYEMEPGNYEYRMAYVSMAGSGRVRYNTTGRSMAGLGGTCGLCGCILCSRMLGYTCVPCFC